MKIYFLISLLLAVPLLAGCIGEKNAEPGSQSGTGGQEGQIYAPPQDSGKAEVTVISVTKRSIDGGAPTDYAKIRVDKILNYTRDARATFDPLKEGAEFDQAQFAYSTRPAKIRHIPIPKIGYSNKPAENNGEAVAPRVEPNESISRNITVPIEGGFYLYELSSGRFEQEYNTTLPGVKDGDRITVELFYGDGSRIKLGEYEVIPSEAG